MGADCSGVTMAVTNNVAVPNGIQIVSPSATSPALTTIEDNGLFFHTAPSDARQGEVIADILADEGVGNVAVTYTNNDYGKGIIQVSVYTGAFEHFIIADAMIGQAVIDALGDAAGNTIGTLPGSDSRGAVGPDQLAMIRASQCSWSSIMRHRRSPSQIVATSS